MQCMLLAALAAGVSALLGTIIGMAVTVVVEMNVTRADGRLRGVAATGDITPA